VSESGHGVTDAWLRPGTSVHKVCARNAPDRPADNRFALKADVTHESRAWATREQTIAKQ
jgi:hypothetical protein